MLLGNSVSVTSTKHYVSSTLPKVQVESRGNPRGKGEKDTSLRLKANGVISNARWT